MLIINIKTNLKEEELQKFRMQEEEQFHKAIKSLKEIDNLMPFIKKRLAKQNIDMVKLDKALEQYREGYDFFIDIREGNLNLTWDGHYFLDYEDEEIARILFKMMNAWRAIWNVPFLIKQKLTGIRDIKDYFKPKLNEPTIKEQYIKALMEEVERRFKKKDLGCAITYEYIQPIKE
jgi:hypothetical protein